MSCFRPLRGEPVFRPDGTKWVSLSQGGSLELPCGKCVGCRMDRARAWSIRITHEAMCWDSNFFVTLDYAPEFLQSWSLRYADFQGFMRRLRKRGAGIRFFVAGEYGKLYRRPHWHAILFNLTLPDAEELQNGTLRSSSLERLWGRGNVVAGGVTAQSAAYVAGYTQSKSYGRAAQAAYEDLVDPETGEVSSRRPEFCQMSRDPGIGAYWYKRFAGDLFPEDQAIQEGKTWKVPRYYWNRFKEDHPLDAEEVAYERYLRALVLDPEESTPERRAVREEVSEARVRLFSERNH